jgi:hypothetical protein
MPISNELPSSGWSPEIGLHLLLRAHIRGGYSFDEGVTTMKIERWHL